MSASWRVGNPFGISVYIHWSFWLLPAWVLATHDPAGPVSLGMQLALVFTLFACVFLHELGHALAARSFGIGTESITLSPLGGMAKLDRMAWRPLEEFCIALAGPLVNVAIAAVLAGVLLAGMYIQPGFLETPAGTFCGLLWIMNLVMVVFNLLPAFPMDGGRVLRSALAGAVGTLPATRVAVTIGGAVAVVFGFAGAIYLHNVFLPFIAVFVIWAGMQELIALEARDHPAAEDDADDLPVALPVPRSTPRWPPLAPVVLVYSWDPRRQSWIPQPRESSIRPVG